MKKHYYILIILLLIKLKLFSQQPEQDSVLSITYKLDVKILSDSIPSYISNYILQEYGDSLKILINPNGSMRYDYYGNGRKGYEFSLYDNKTNLHYTKWKNIDTIYYYNVGTNSLRLIKFQKLGVQKINSIECNVLKYDAVDYNHPYYPVKQIFYFNKKTLKINSEFFKNYKDFFFYDYLKKSKSMYIKRIVEVPEYRLTFTLLNYDQNKKINSNIFNIPNNLPLKEY